MSVLKSRICFFINKKIIVPLNDKVLILIILIIVLISIISIGYYFKLFPELSNDPTDWAYFGSFVAPFFSLIAIAVVLYSIYEARNRETKNQIKEKFERLAYSIVRMYNLFKKTEFNTLRQNTKNNDTINEEIECLLSETELIVNLYFTNEIGATAFTFSELMTYIINNKINTDSKFSEIVSIYNSVMALLNTFVVNDKIRTKREYDLFSREREKNLKYIQDKTGYPIYNLWKDNPELLKKKNTDNEQKT